MSAVSKLEAKVAKEGQSPPHRFISKLVENRLVAAEVNHLIFDVPPKDRFSFTPGQYVTFYLPRNGRNITKSYSIASHPGDGTGFELLVKRVQKGYVSNLLCDAQPEAEFSTLAPLGKYAVHDPEGRSVVFVSTGTGIAPYFPMADEIRLRYPSTRVTIIAGYRTEEGVIMPERFEPLGDSWPGFRYVTVLSRAADSWKGERGHVQDVILKDFQDLSDHDVYICGVPGMVNEVQELAIRLGCPKERVFVERY